MKGKIRILLETVQLQGTRFCDPLTPFGSNMSAQTSPSPTKLEALCFGSLKNCPFLPNFLPLEHTKNWWWIFPKHGKCLAEIDVAGSRNGGIHWCHHASQRGHRFLGHRACQSRQRRWPFPDRKPHQAQWQHCRKEEGVIAGAGLDVTTTEPPSEDSKLWNFLMSE